MPLSHVTTSNTVNDYINNLNTVMDWINAICSANGVISLSGSITTTANSSANNLSVTNTISGLSLAVTANTTSNNISATNTVSALNLAATANTTANNVTANNIVANSTLKVGSVAVALSNTTITGSGLVTGGGALSANRVLTVPAAANTDIVTGTDNTKAVTSLALAYPLSLKAPLASPGFTGTPTAPTPSTTDNSTSVATTAYVQGQPFAYGITQGVPNCTDLNTAPLGYSMAADTANNSPAPGDWLLALSVSVDGTNTPSANTTITQFAYDVVNFGNVYVRMNAIGDGWSSWTQYAFLSSPAFTGSPTAPTASAGTNTTQLATTAFVLANSLSPTATDQTIWGGAVVASASLTTGSITVDPGTRPLQYITNGGAFTITAPANDGSCVILVTNNSTAGAITFSGFTVGSNTGDALNTTNGSKFLIYIVRINGVATYTIKALQ